MKAAGAPLISLLATSRALAMADLYDFTLADGTTHLRYTSAQRSVGAYTALGPKLKRGQTRSVIGVEVDTLTVTLMVDADVTVANIPMTQFALNGGFDGAHLELQRSFASSWAVAPAGNLPLFSGRVADVELTGSAIELAINSDLELLNIQMPRNLYQASCLHSLYDDGCGIVAASYTVTGNVAANSTTTTLVCNLSANAGYFTLGTVAFTSGPNVGVQRTVRAHPLAGTLEVVPPLQYTPAPGDLFTARPGCDKLQTTCNATFNNTGNFRAFPFIPNPESAY